MKKLDQPNYSFDITAPTYSEISRIIRKMKSGSSACHFDQSQYLSVEKLPNATNCPSPNYVTLLGQGIAT